MSELKNSLKQLSWLTKSQKVTGAGKGTNVKVLFVGRNGRLPASFVQTAPPSIKKKVKTGSTVESWVSNSGPVWVIQSQFVEAKSHYGLFAPSAFSMARDLMGTCFRQMTGEPVKSMSIEYSGGSADEFKGLCVGIELSQYRFKKAWPKPYQSVFKVKFKSDLKEQASLIK